MAGHIGGGCGSVYARRTLLALRAQEVAGQLFDLRIAERTEPAAGTLTADHRRQDGLRIESLGHQVWRIDQPR